ncbi:hypothetical protein [Streptomyces sp. Y7]|uniref:hypothetical protein n=1 Tax=Streptomyces sp. Y7 TaxID=3342392 RepID=UPI003716DC1C
MSVEQILTPAAWPLMALTLVWLAHRAPARYARLGFALVLSSAAGLAAFVSSHGFPESQTSLLSDYLALPGVGASWYVLMALAVAATVVRPRIRAAALLTALTAVTWEVLAADSRLLAALLAVGAPVVTWFVAGIPIRSRVRLGGATSASPTVAPSADVIALPSRAVGAASVPVRRAA